MQQCEQGKTNGRYAFTVRSAVKVVADIVVIGVCCVILLRADSALYYTSFTILYSLISFSLLIDYVSLSTCERFRMLHASIL